MNFKEMLKSDLDIFINLDEFAEMVKIGDKEYPAILTYSSDETAQVYDGIIIKVDLTISMKHDEEIFNRYIEGTAVNINDVPYIVNKVHSVDGILTYYLLKSQGR